jgi:nicotinamidase-related amidase
LLGHARQEGWLVVFSNDAHMPGDPEPRMWGEHAMAGTHEAEVISPLAPREDDVISPKRVYGAFDFTGGGKPPQLGRATDAQSAGPPLQIGFV